MNTQDYYGTILETNSMNMSVLIHTMKGKESFKADMQMLFKLSKVCHKKVKLTVSMTERKVISFEV